MAYRRRELEDAQATQGGQAGNTPTVAGLIRYLAAAFSARMSEERLQTYLDALHGIDRDAIEAAVNTIRDCVQYAIASHSPVWCERSRCRQPEIPETLLRLKSLRLSVLRLRRSMPHSNKRGEIIRTRCSSLSCWRCVIAQRGSRRR